MRIFSTAETTASFTTLISQRKLSVIGHFFVAKLAVIGGAKQSLVPPPPCQFMSARVNANVRDWPVSMSGLKPARVNAP